MSGRVCGVRGRPAKWLKSESRALAGAPLTRRLPPRLALPKRRNQQQPLPPCPPTDPGPAGDGMPQRDWLALVAVHSDSWLLAVSFFYAVKLDAQGRWVGRGWVDGGGCCCC